jgi:DNA-binding XRE family transcriptional regulator
MPRKAKPKDNPIAPPNNLRAYRERAFLTQAELAERIGMSRQAIQSIEAQNARPYPQTMRAIAKVLQISPKLIFPNVGVDAQSENFSSVA